MAISVNNPNTPAANNANEPYAKMRLGFGAKVALKTVIGRKDSFRMNEFGDVEANNFAEFKLKHLENKALLEGRTRRAAAAKDVTDLLSGKQIGIVRESHGPQATHKPQQPQKPTNFLEAVGVFFAGLADRLNIPTTWRANRMQDEMELRFGRVAGNMLNLSHLEKSKEYSAKRQSVNVNVADAQKAVKESLVQYFEQRNAFVKKFGLDKESYRFEKNKRSLDGAKNCDRLIVSRLVHSLENAGDEDSLRRLHKVADEWLKEWKMQPNRGPADNVTSIMTELRDRIALRLGIGVEYAEAAVPVQPKKTAEPPKLFEGLTKLIDQWKSTLKSTLTKRVAELKETCKGTANEMEVYQLGFEEFSKKLHAVLSETDKEGFSLDNLSVDAFMDLVERMNTEIGSIIDDGVDVIEKLHKKMHDSKGKVLATLTPGGGSPKYTEIDIKKTNKYLQRVLKNTQMNADRAKLHYEGQDLRETNLDATESGGNDKRTDATKRKNGPQGASGKKQKPENPKLIISAMNSVNKAIEAFSAAKHELYHSIRPIVEKLEFVELLAKKESTPPKNPNPPPAAKENCTPEEAEAAKVAAEAAEAKWKADWKDACNAVGKYLNSGFKSDMDDVSKAHLKLISDHKEHFIQGLDDKSKQRLELLFDYERLSRGFARQFELSDLALSCSSFEMCRDSTTEVYMELLENIKDLEKNCGIKPERCNVAKILREELEMSCVAYFSGKVKGGVKDTVEDRHNGVYLNGDAKGRPTSDATSKGTLLWISNDDLKDLATHLFSTIRRVGGAFAQEAASEMVALKDPDLTDRRLELMKEGQGYLKPLIRAYRDVRGIIATNALTRINDGIQNIRFAVPPTETEESWNKLCDDAETAIKSIKGNNVQNALDALNALYSKIEEAVSNADGTTSSNIATLKMIEEKFSEDLNRLELYGERGKGIMSADLGVMHINRMIWNMDNLTAAEWRARDIESLVSDALQSIPNFIKAIGKAHNGAFLSKWLKVTPDALERFSISADKLRKNFSDYTKSVKAYLQTLRMESLTSDERKIAADAVRERLGACITSVAPVMELMADIEVFMCERFEGYDDPNDIESQVRSPILVDKDFSDRFAELHRSVHGMFAAFSEVGKGAMLDVQDYVKEDSLTVLSSGKVKYSNELWQIASEKILSDNYGKRCKIVDHEVLLPVTGKTRKEGQLPDSPEMAHVRRTLRNEFSSESTNLSASMFIRGSASDELFSSMERFYLMLAKAKQSRHGTTYVDDDERVIKYFEDKKIAKAKADAKAANIKYKAPPPVKLTQEQKAAKEAEKAKKDAERKAEEAKQAKKPSVAVLEQIGRLVARRTPVKNLEVLKAYLRANNVAEDEIKTLDNAENSDFVEDLVAHLESLAKKFAAFGVEEFGSGPIEQQIADLNKFLRLAKIDKDYSITAIDITNGEATRVAVRSERLGKEAYYTVHYTPGCNKTGHEDLTLSRIDFVPEANTNVKDGKATAKEFKPFHIMKMYKVTNRTGLSKSEAKMVSCPITVQQLKNSRQVLEESTDYTLKSIVEPETGNEEEENLSVAEDEGENDFDVEDVMDGLEIDQDPDELYGYGNGEE